MKRIVILSRQSIFSRGIESLLNQEAEIEVVSWELDPGALVDCMQSCRPDVVIVNCDEPEADLTPALTCVLRERLGICVIGLSLRDNKMVICRGEQKEIRQIEDLLKAIQE